MSNLPIVTKRLSNKMTDAMYKFSFFTDYAPIKTTAHISITSTSYYNKETHTKFLTLEKMILHCYVVDAQVFCCLFFPEESAMNTHR